MTEPYEWLEGATHTLTPGAEWNGADKYIGTTEFARWDEGDKQFYTMDKIATNFLMHATSWVVKEARPFEQIKLIPERVCDKKLLEKQLKVKGAIEFFEAFRAQGFSTVGHHSLKAYVDYVMHEE